MARDHVAQEEAPEAQSLQSQLLALSEGNMHTRVEPVSNQVFHQRARPLTSRALAEPKSISTSSVIQKRSEATAPLQEWTSSHLLARAAPIAELIQKQPKAAITREPTLNSPTTGPSQMLIALLR